MSMEKKKKEKKTCQALRLAGFRLEILPNQYTLNTPPPSVVDPE
jgi:hypothetical protein